MRDAILLKACTKCHGDLFLPQDAHDAEWECLQCGKTYYSQPVMSASVQMTSAQPSQLFAAATLQAAMEVPHR